MGSECPPEIMGLWKPGRGNAICFDFLSSNPVRRRNNEAKASVRRQNLRRLARKFPLFAQLYAEEASGPTSTVSDPLETSRH